MDGERKPQGLATLTEERRREIARMGGKAAQAGGRGHRWSPEEARAAGSKGGKAAQAAKSKANGEQPESA
jgi:uncharacterized protein